MRKKFLFCLSVIKGLVKTKDKTNKMRIFFPPIPWAQPEFLLFSRLQRAKFRANRGCCEYSENILNEAIKQSKVHFFLNEQPIFFTSNVQNWTEIRDTDGEKKKIVHP